MIIFNCIDNVFVKVIEFCPTTSLNVDGLYFLAETIKLFINKQN